MIMAGVIALPPYDVVTKWEVRQVINWLKKVDLNECVPAFEDRRINGSKLLDLTEQKLFTYQDLKIKHRRQIAKCVKECKSHSSNSTRIRAVKCLSENENVYPISSDAAANESDSDAWDTDFDDDTETEVNTEEVEQLNNNVVKEQSVESASSEKDCEPNISTLRNKPIPKPPDHPLVSKIPLLGEGQKSVMQKSTMPRPPLRRPISRPLSQPPPPPMAQVPSPSKEQEEYEIPINSSLGSDVNISKACLDNFATSSLTTEVPRLSPKQLSSDSCSIETYEVIESPEENYEIVDETKCFQSSEHSFEPVSSKPTLPPRILHMLPISPPPLPQKPHKLQSSVAHKADVLKAALPVLKSEQLLENSDSAEAGNHSVVFNSLGARKYSMPNSFSPSQNMKFSGSDPMVFSSASVFLHTEDNLSRSSSPDKEVSFSIGSSKYLSSSMSSVTVDAPKSSSPPPLPSRYVTTFSEDTAQIMATRPLPPVPTSTKDEHMSITCKQEEYFVQPWFHDIEREKAELEIKNMGANGAFLVRPSKRAGKNNPLTLTVLNDERVFHLNIRQRADDKFALGKEKAKEKIFHSVPELISFHQREPIILTSGGKSAGQTNLKIFPGK